MKPVELGESDYSGLKVGTFSSSQFIFFFFIKKSPKLSKCCHSIFFFPLLKVFTFKLVEKILKGKSSLDLGIYLYKIKRNKNRNKTELLDCKSSQSLERVQNTVVCSL